jgi:hypothetical protein
MGKRHGHYERAFEEWLRQRRVPYVPVTQVRRPSDAAGPLKHFDFLVHAPHDRHYIVDVKGKRFPQLSRGREAFWENWVHLEDLEGLLSWETHFGEGYEGLLVYAYWLQTPDGDEVRKTLSFRGRDYLMVAVPARTYAEHCRRRSTRWQALSIPTKEFPRLVKPIETFFTE